MPSQVGHFRKPNGTLFGYRDDSQRKGGTFFGHQVDHFSIDKNNRDLNAAINILLVGSGRSELTPVERGVPLISESSLSMNQEAPSVRAG